MNYNLIVDTDRLKEIIKDINNTNDDMMSSLSYIEDTINELPNSFSGMVADAFLENISNYLDEIKQVCVVNDEIAHTISILSDEYEAKDSEYASRNNRME